MVAHDSALSKVAAWWRRLRNPLPPAAPRPEVDTSLVVVRLARTPGTPNSEDGLGHELKTTVDDELFAQFLVKAQPAGGRARVLRDLVCMYCNDGLTYDEHVAKRRREQHFGTGQVIAHSGKAS